MQKISFWISIIEFLNIWNISEMIKIASNLYLWMFRKRTTDINLHTDETNWRMFKKKPRAERKTRSFHSMKNYLLNKDNWGVGLILKDIFPVMVTDCHAGFNHMWHVRYGEGSFRKHEMQQNRDLGLKNL